MVLIGSLVNREYLFILIIKRSPMKIRVVGRGPVLNLEEEMDCVT